MMDPSRVRVTGPFARYAPGFVAELVGAGYRPNAAVVQLRLLAHLSRWLEREGIDPVDVREPQLERFRREDLARVRSLRIAGGLVPLLGYLRGLGVVPAADEPALSNVELLLERYREYLLCRAGRDGRHRARLYRLCSPVRFLARAWRRRGRSRRAHATGRARVRAGGLPAQAAALGEADGDGAAVAASVLACRRVDRPAAGAGGAVGGFLAASRVAARTRRRPGPARCLRAATPTRSTAVVIWRSCCCWCGWGCVAARSLAFGSRTSTGGPASCSCEARGARVERLPLPADVGEALAGYLRDGRPAGAGTRAVFMRVRAPRAALTPPGITQVVVAAGRRAGLGDLGPHRLRHTAASELLRRGAPLAEIGQLLRHRTELTTTIYAKVDRDRLRELALPWPGGAA